MKEEGLVLICLYTLCAPGAVWSQHGPTHQSKKKSTWQSKSFVTNKMGKSWNEGDVVPILDGSVMDLQVRLKTESGWVGSDVTGSGEDIANLNQEIIFILPTYWPLVWVIKLVKYHEDISTLEMCKSCSIYLSLQYTFSVILISIFYILVNA